MTTEPEQKAPEEKTGEEAEEDAIGDQTQRDGFASEVQRREQVKRTSSSDTIPAVKPDAVGEVYDPTQRPSTGNFDAYLVQAARDRGGSKRFSRPPVPFEETLFPPKKK